MSSASSKSEAVTIPLDVAVLVSRAFLPLNPNKLRNATPEVKTAAHAFKDAVRDAVLKATSPQRASGDQT